MAETTTTKIYEVEIKATEAFKSLIDMKNQAKELKAEMDKLDVSTEKGAESYYDLASKLKAVNAEAAKYQKEIQNNIVKQSANTGSLKSLRAELSNLTKQYDELSAAERNGTTGEEKLKQITAVTNEIKEAEEATQRYYRNVGNYENAVTNAFADLRKEIKDYRSQLLTLQEGTEEYAATMQKLADAQFKLKDMNEIASHSADDLGEKLATLTRISGGLAAGFSVVQSGLALTGKESEELEKVMIRLQASIALVQGLQGLEGLGKDLQIARQQFGGALTSVKAFIGGLSGVKKALYATGIGVLIGALGTLVANWDKITEAIMGSNDEAERHRQYMEEILDNSNKYIDNLNHEIALMKIRGASELDALKTKRKDLEAEKERLQAQIELNEKRIYTEDLGGRLRKQMYKDNEALAEQIEKISGQIAEVDKSIELETARVEEAEKKKREEYQKTQDAARDAAKAKSEEEAVKRAEEAGKAYAKAIEDEAKRRRDIMVREAEIRMGLMDKESLEYQNALELELQLQAEAEIKKLEQEEGTAELIRLIREQLARDLAELDEEMLGDVDGMLEEMTNKTLDEINNTNAQIAEMTEERKQMAKDMVLSSVDSFNQLFDAMSQRASERIAERYDSEQDALDRKLAHQMISQEEYDKQTEELEKQRAKEEAKLARQDAIRERVQALFQIAMSTAEGIMKSVASSPMTGGLPWSAIVGALGAVQAAAVMAQPLPKAAKGKYIEGPSHAMGGVQIEAEGGEAIINRRSTSAFLPLLSAINQAGGGIPFMKPGTDGGYAIRSSLSTAKGMTRADMENAIEKAFNKVKVVATIEDIRREDANYMKIESSGTF
jgi:predicted  nucleic acid-binding Zn-ribbon protein|nr:MAG TPA: hypothetical protein [Caudoviricetes sp.]